MPVDLAERLPHAVLVVVLDDGAGEALEGVAVAGHAPGQDLVLVRRDQPGIIFKG